MAAPHPLTMTDAELADSLRRCEIALAGAAKAGTTGDLFRARAGEIATEIARRSHTGPRASATYPTAEAIRNAGQPCPACLGSGWVTTTTIETCPHGCLPAEVARAADHGECCAEECTGSGTTWDEHTECCSSECADR